MNKRTLWIFAVAAALISGSAAAWIGAGNGDGAGMMYAAGAAAQADPGTAARPGYYGMGPGMAGARGAGPGMMYGYGGRGPGAGMIGDCDAGYGVRPGMRYGEGYGMGPGFMHGGGDYGMGPGFMHGGGGYGMGSGFMHGSAGDGLRPGMARGRGYGPGYGMGPGTRYGQRGGALGLSAQQRDQIAVIWNEAVQKSWPIMGQLHEQYFQFSRLLGKEQLDRAALDAAYGHILDLRKKLFDFRLEAHQQMLKVLTPEQRKQLRRGYHWR